MGLRVRQGRGLRGLVVVSAVGALVAVAGCTPSRHATVVVTPPASRGDDPVAIKVTGLPKDAATDIAVTSTDAAGETWSSQASYAADADGVVDVGTASSTGGSYLGVSPMGLITAMRTADAPSRPNLTYRAPGSGPSTFRITAHARGVHQTATFTRTFFPDPVTTKTLTLAQEHISGMYVAPAKPTSRHPAVLLLGGSNGGIASVPLAQGFAARGVPALAIAYFGAPGLPKNLADVPLEYFVTAVTWLARQPGVDPERVWVSGGSYGSEAALLVGARHPELVHGVLSLSGGNTVTCSVIPGGRIDSCTQPPFTSGGRPVPFTRQFNDPAPTDDPAAIIPVEKIRGPVLAVCGGADLEWDACRLSQAVLDRRRQHGTGQDDLLLSYPDAGHYVNFLLANRPIDTAADDKNNGSTPQANPDADADAWPKVIAHLDGT